MNDFVTYLNDELGKRREKNPCYSLRAFAKSLGIHHGSLSFILRKRRSLTKEMVKNLGANLKLPPEKIDVFVSGIPYDYESFHRTRQKIKRMNQLSLDQFELIAEWYHDAILELTRTVGFKHNAADVSHRLGLSKEVAQEAIDRLFRLGLLVEDEKKNWKEAMGDTTTSGDLTFTNAALIHHQKQALEKSLASLNLPKTARDHSTVTLAMNKSDLPMARTMMQRFCRELMSYLQREGEPADEVYQLAVSLYPLTTGETPPVI